MVKSVKEIFRSYAVLDENGRHINGSDKESNHHYGDAYESLFFDRKSVSLVMEVGIADGSCLLAWRDIFPNAHIVGMDIHPSAKAHGGRIEFHIGDMRSLVACRRAAGGRLFNLIVEDATHQLGDTLCCLLYLWPYVKPGGLYVIEEFANIGELSLHVASLFPGVELIGTCGPKLQDEPLVVFRKPYDS